MKRIVLLFAAGWLLAHPALAAEKKGKGKAKGTAADSAELAKPQVDPKLKDATSTARYLFFRRVDLCAPPQRCTQDVQGVIEDAEQRFMDACRACAPAERCDADRTAIRSGKASSGFNPCG